MRSDVVTILVCRDCCCGNVRKHPEVDHEAHLTRIASAARSMGGARVLVTRCLLTIERRGRAHPRRLALTNPLARGRVVDAFEMVADDACREAISGHLPDDKASQARVPIVEERLAAIAGLRI